MSVGIAVLGAAEAVERTVLEPGKIDVVLRNAGPEALTIAQVIVNDGVRPMTVSPSATIPWLGQATLHLEYGRVEGAPLFSVSR